MVVWIGTLMIEILVVNYVLASDGDNSPYYQKCLEKCSIINCTDDGLNFKLSTYKQPLALVVTQWTCEDECKYACMWKTVQAFHGWKWRTPQFYGKWPFVRILGIQEPASTLFSILNGLVHVFMIKRFRREVRPDSPFVWLWNIFFIVGINTWIWSTIFHTRDLPLTELLDYVSAFSLVSINFYIMLIRVLKDKISTTVLFAITVFLIIFYISHVNYLCKKFDYGYNMKLNIVVGTFAAIGWLGWSVYSWPKQPYTKKCTLYVILTVLITLLELGDTPPFLYMIDFHSLWHLFTAPLTILFYLFGIDDCKYLKQNQVESVNKFTKIP